MYYDFYLAHTGVSKADGAPGPGSGRYPLGSGDRPYQGKRWRSRRQKKLEKRISRRESKQLGEIEKGSDLEKIKERTLFSGRASDVLKFKGRLTNAELQYAVNRLDLERKLLSYSLDEKENGIKYVDHMAKNIKSINEWGNIGIDVWNNVASIYNTVNPDANLRRVNKGK